MRRVRRSATLDADIAVGDAFRVVQLTHPFGMVMQVNPARSPFPRIKVQHLTGNPANLPDSQLWGAETGIV